MDSGDITDRLDANFALGISVSRHLDGRHQLQSPYKESFTRELLAKAVVGPKSLLSQSSRPKPTFFKGYGNYLDEVLNTY